MKPTDTNADAVKLRVKDFTYYPLMSDIQCAFRLNGPRATYRQCQKYAQIDIEGYRFCKRHAEQIRTIVSKENG